MAGLYLNHVKVAEESGGIVSLPNTVQFNNLKIGGTEVINSNRQIQNITGIDFGSSSLLTDYEEGTWIPSLTASTSGTITVDSSTSTCWYIKVGRVVHFGGRINTSATSAPTGDLYLEGFPFSSATVTNGQNSITFSVGFVNLGVALSGSVSVYWIPGESKSRLRDGGNSTNSGGTIANHIDGSTTMYINGSYLVD